MIAQKVVDKINSLSHEYMTWLWRYAQTGHKYFDSIQPYYEIFMLRFEEFKKITPNHYICNVLNDKIRINNNIMDYYIIITLDNVLEYHYNILVYHYIINLI